MALSSSCEQVLAICYAGLTQVCPTPCHLCSADCTCAVFSPHRRPASYAHPLRPCLAPLGAPTRVWRAGGGHVHVHVHGAGLVVALAGVAHLHAWGRCVYLRTPPFGRRGAMRGWGGHRCRSTLAGPLERLPHAHVHVWCVAHSCHLRYTLRISGLRIFASCVSKEAKSGRRQRYPHTHTRHTRPRPPTPHRGSPKPPPRAPRTRPRHPRT